MAIFGRYDGEGHANNMGRADDYARALREQGYAASVVPLLPHTNTFQAYGVQVPDEQATQLMRAWHEQQYGSISALIDEALRGESDEVLCWQEKFYAKAREAVEAMGEERQWLTIWEHFDVVTARQMAQYWREQSTPR